jgi:two-component system chemotaxis response regulator CheY
MPVKVLIVDDSVLLHRMYELALRAYRSQAVEPHFASNGREGLIRLQAHPDVALILLDVNMPTMSGLDFLKQVKAEPAIAGIPVVMQSTEDQQDDIQRALELGATGYLTKPFTPAQLHALLDDLLPAARA